MRKFSQIILFFLSIIFGFWISNMNFKIESNISIIPQPNNIKVLSGEFTLNSKTKIFIPSNNNRVKSVAKFFNSYLNASIGFELPIDSSNGAKENSITLNLVDEKSLGAEGYTLLVNKGGVKISGNEAGLFYGIVSLLQLLPSEIWSKKNVPDIKLTIPFVSIEDMPKFEWRGMHLDVGRHMFSVEDIKSYIDLLAMHKMNVFHWHLTEDQGWRIEIKKYPKLQTISAYRDETLVGYHRDTPQKFDGKRYGGFYSQEEVKEIVKYAKDRFITVVPEIEMPGHSVAVLAAYPEFSCTGGPFEVRTSWGISKDIYCAGKEKTFKFLEDVLSEVMNLFPSKFIHIGGDEAPKVRWEKCPDCQKRIADEGLKNEEELQSYFIQRIEKFLNEHGRKIIGWDEILEGGLAPNAAVMSWRGNEGGIAAANQKHNVVMTPTSHCYFDYYQTRNREHEPLANGGYLPLKKVYSFNPISDEISKENKKYIIGAQGNVWTENMPTFKLVEYMALPRMSAMAEDVWTDVRNKNYKDFETRMIKQYKRFNAIGANYFEKGK